MAFSQTWDCDADWAAFTGGRRYFEDGMSLAYQSVATLPEINATGRLFHYRWGQLAGTAAPNFDVSGNSRTARLLSSGTRTLTVTSDGLNGVPDAAGGDGVPYMLPTAEVADLAPLLSSETDPIIPSFVIQFWANCEDTTDPRVVFAINRGDSEALHFQLQFIRAAGMAHAQFRFSDWNYDLNYYTSYNSVWYPSTIDFPTGLHHWLFHLYFTDTGPAWHIFRDGLFVWGDNRDYYGPHRRVSGWEPFKLSWFDGYVDLMPMFAAGDLNIWAGDSNSPSNGAVCGFTINAETHRWRGQIDEMCWFKAWPQIDGDGNPINLDAAPAGWVEGTTQVFSVSRHPDRDVVGQDAEDFIVYSPVVDASPTSGAITAVKVGYTLPGTTSGQAVWFAVRAGTADSIAAQAWSAWHQATQTDTWYSTSTAGSGTGTHVQVRLKLYPSDDDLKLSSPRISALDISVNEVEAEVEANADLQTEGFVLGLQCLCSDVEVKQPADADLQGILAVTSPGEAYLQADAWVLAQDSLVGRAEVYQVTDTTPSWVWWSGLHLSAEAQTPLHEAQGDFQATINVNLIQSDLAAEVFVCAHDDLQGQIRIATACFQATADVLWTGSAYLLAQAKVKLEQPGSCAPVMVDIDGGVWVNNPARSFAWNAAAYVVSPVVGYVYKVSASSNEQADPSWASLPAGNLNLTLILPGQGHWYFHVAAVNALGQYGLTAYAEARYNAIPVWPLDFQMRIDGLRCDLPIPPLVARYPLSPHGLSWTAASDPSDTVKYELQVASRADFGVIPETGQPSIELTVQNPSFVNALSYAIAQSLPAGTHFWRIRPWDGKQYGGWSVTGRFQVNAPPSGPSGLAVAQ